MIDDNPMVEGVLYETRQYECRRGQASVLIRRLVDVNTSESLYFGQAQVTMEVPTPQGPARVAQAIWFPIEGATSPQHALQLSEAAFEKHKQKQMGSPGILVPSGPVPPIPPRPLPNLRNPGRNGS